MPDIKHLGCKTGFGIHIDRQNIHSLRTRLASIQSIAVAKNAVPVSPEYNYMP
jgi:hypothetical protein